jgi:hypothetical protein
MKNGYRLLCLFAMLAFCLFIIVPASAQTPTPEPIKTYQGDKLVIGDTFRLKVGEVLEGNLAVIGSTANIEKGAVVNGDVILTGGTIAIEGTVNGNVLAIGGAVNIEDTAAINGDVVSVGASVKHSALAKISGQITEQAPINLNFNTAKESSPAQTKQDLLAKLLTAAFESLAMAALAVVLALVFPEQIKRVSDALSKEPLVCGGVGLLIIIGAPVALIILTITIILIPVTIVASMLLALALIYSWMVVGYNLGYRLSHLFHASWPTPVASGIGVLILSLVVGLIFLIPCIGWIIGFILSLIGLGAVVISRFGSTRYANKLAQTTVLSQIPPGPPQTPEASK